MIRKLAEVGASRSLLASALGIACLLLSGCGRSNSEPPDILKTEREAMEKARATEKVLQDSAEHRDAQIETQQK